METLKDTLVKNWNIVAILFSILLFCLIKPDLTPFTNFLQQPISNISVLDALVIISIARFLGLFKNK